MDYYVLTQMGVLPLLWAGLFLFLVVYLLYSSVVIVQGEELAILERRWLGRKLPPGRVIATDRGVGVQARTLAPGLHLLIPFIYKVTKSPFLAIGNNQIGLVESIDGAPIPSGRIFAKVVPGHNSFQDGEAFLLNGGEKGPQIEVIPPGKYRVNTALFEVSIVDSIVIPQGRIGVVSSQDGQSIAPGRLLAMHVEGHCNFEDGDAFLKNGGQKGPQIDILLPGTYRINTKLFTVTPDNAMIVEQGKIGLVTALDGIPLADNEYVATSVAGHGDFQNAQAFIDSQGQRGPQLDVLRPGTYYINPLMFSVTINDNTVVERGQVAVIVSNIGKEPSDEMKKRINSSQVDTVGGSAQETYVVPKGYRGIQEEVVGPGRYYLNRIAYIPYVVDTTNITIDWDSSANTKFDPLQVISKDGFPIEVSVKVVVRVRPDQAPYMIAKVGSIENLIRNVIHPMIDSSFRNQASSSSAMNFMQSRKEEQTRAEESTRHELEKYHVECVSVLICQIKLPQDLMDTQTKKIIAEQQRAQFASQQEAEQSRIATEKTRAEADQQASLVTAEIGVKVAAQNRQKAIVEAEGLGKAKQVMAEGEAAGIRALGEAEGAKILSIGEATAKAYSLQNEAIGGAGVTAIEIAKQISEGQVKVTPDFLVQGCEAGGLSGLLSAFLTRLITNPGEGDRTPVGLVSPPAENDTPAQE